MRHDSPQLLDVTYLLCVPDEMTFCMGEMAAAMLVATLQLESGAHLSFFRGLLPSSRNMEIFGTFDAGRDLVALGSISCRVRVVRRRIWQDSTSGGGGGLGDPVSKSSAILLPAPLDALSSRHHTAHKRRGAVAFLPRKPAQNRQALHEWKQGSKKREKCCSGVAVWAQTDCRQTTWRAGKRKTRLDNSSCVSR
jgi:hypothetical protein